jgi:hypothetical protein
MLCLDVGCRSEMDSDKGERNGERKEDSANAGGGRRAVMQRKAGLRKDPAS